ncbi:hypothetical protein NE865_15643 [Phthorimaea operculella]|nr:hypothetical protein NE865_15643 [Phthorimaea operculella]
MDFEPMDVDKSASSASKMDISFNDTDPDVFILDDDDVPSGKTTAMKVSTPSPQSRNDDIFSNSYNVTMKIKQEKPDEPNTLSTETIQDNSLHTQQEVKTEQSTKTRPKSSVKKYHIKMQHLKKKEPPSKFKFLVLGALVLLVSIVAYQVINFKCVDEIDLGSLRRSFNEKLFGQSAAANKIIEVLNIEDKSKIIFLYGGTGVGKTYATSLLLEKLWNSGNVYHYTMPTFADTFTPELMLGLTVCKTSIIVVDDLTRSDMHITPHIKSVIAKSEKLGKSITVILVYNCDNITENFVKKCDESFQRELKESFADIPVEQYFVKFQPLEQNHLRKCIVKELGNRKVSEQVMNNILKNFDVSLDGCKGVYTKIKFLNMI